jgi:hypothetical protein
VCVCVCVCARARAHLVPPFAFKSRFLVNLPCSQLFLGGSSEGPMGSRVHSAAHQSSTGSGTQLPVHLSNGSTGLLNQPVCPSLELLGVHGRGFSIDDAACNACS